MLILQSKSIGTFNGEVWPWTLSLGTYSYTYICFKHCHLSTYLHYLLASSIVNSAKVRRFLTRYAIAQQNSTLKTITSPRSVCVDAIVAAAAVIIVTLVYIATCLVVLVEEVSSKAKTRDFASGAVFCAVLQLETHVMARESVTWNWSCNFSAIN